MKSKDKIASPRDRVTCIKVAFARLQGMTQEAAAAAYGVTARTVQNWEAQSWWPDILKEADVEFVEVAVAKARRTLLQTLDEGDVATAKWVLSKMQSIERIKAAQEREQMGAPEIQNVVDALWAMAHDKSVPAGARAQALATLLKDMRGEPIEVSDDPEAVLEFIKMSLNARAAELQ
jgi:transcriptional regulator with XRE-family HTH domain